jgi:hypothetical protein
MIRILFISIFFIVAACSSKSVYEATQNSRLIECNTLQGEVYEQCIEENATPYEDYKRERDAAIKE